MNDPEPIDALALARRILSGEQKSASWAEIDVLAQAVLLLAEHPAIRVDLDALQTPFEKESNHG